MTYYITVLTANSVIVDEVRTNNQNVVLMVRGYYEALGCIVNVREEG